jgi:NitT/TauT family transport system permease protein
MRPMALATGSWKTSRREEGPMPDRSSKRVDPRVMLLSLAALVLFWQLLSILKADPSVLPSPTQVWRVTVSEAARGALLHHTLVTLLRVAAAFAISMAIGTALGMMLGAFPGFNRVADPWVIVFLNIPALVVIVLCYLWIGLNEVAAITAVSINKIAMVAVTIREGMLVLDRDIGEMARVYRLSRWKRLRHILLPQLAPFFAAAVRNGLAVIWKIVLVVEFLGRSSGVGFQIHLYFQLFDVAHVLAYALTFVAVMLAIEYLIVKPVERRSGPRH